MIPLKQKKEERFHVNALETTYGGTTCGTTTNSLKSSSVTLYGMFLPMTSLINFSSTRPAVEVLPRSRILGQAHFPCPALKTKMIRFGVRDVLY